MAKIQTKTKTAVGIALAVAVVATAGFLAAGLYYSSSGGPMNCKCDKCQTCTACPACPKCDTAGKDTPPSTPPTSSGRPDLAVTAFTGMGASTFDAGTHYNMPVTITNQGNASTAVANACANKQIAVKIYEGSNGSMKGTPIGTWYVGDLGVGQSVSNKILATTNGNCGMHSYCSFVIKVDADNCVTESKEDNNIHGGGVAMRAR